MKSIFFGIILSSLSLMAFAQAADINDFLRNYRSQYDLVLNARGLYDINPEYFDLEDVCSYLEYMDGGYIRIEEEEEKLDVFFRRDDYSFCNKNAEILKTNSFNSLKDSSNERARHHIAMLFYAFEAEDSLLHCWLVNKNGVHTYGSVKIAEEDLIALEYAFYLKLKSQSKVAINRGIFVEDEEVATLTDSIEYRLAGVLFPGNVDSALLYYSTLLVCPVLNLGTLPWYCLKAFPESNEQIIDKWNVQILESINHMSIVARQAILKEQLGIDVSTRYSYDRVTFKPDNPLVIGNPRYGNCKMVDLKGAEEEANYIAAKLGVRALSGMDAVRDSLITTNWDGKFFNGDFIYIASHAESSCTSPMDSSFIYLSSEADSCNRMSAKEILYLNKLADATIVMSACESGKGRTVTGGVVGLARSFLINGDENYGASFYGARNVVMSLWNIDDHSTYELMKIFMEELGKPQSYYPVAPLRQAMLKYREIDPDPLHWAAFQSMGLSYPGRWIVNLY